MLAARSCRCAGVGRPWHRALTTGACRTSAGREELPQRRAPSGTSAPTQGQRCPPDTAETLRTLHFDKEHPGFVPRKRTGASLEDGGRAGEGSRRTAPLRLFWVLPPVRPQGMQVRRDWHCWEMLPTTKETKGDLCFIRQFLIFLNAAYLTDLRRDKGKPLHP